MQEQSPYPAQKTYIRSEAETIELSPAPMLEEGQPDLRDYWYTIRKHLDVILAVFFGALLLTGLAVLATTPLYTAKSLLLIEPQAPQVLNIKEVLAEPPNDAQHDYYETQYQILKSRSLAEQVITNLGLAENPRFRDEAALAGIFSAAWRNVKGWLTAPAKGDKAAAAANSATPAMVENYLKHLTITPRPDTRLVAIEFSTPDPVLSAQIVNQHVRTYIRQGMDLHAQAGREAQRFLEGKLIELKERVEKSEAALNAYRRDRGIVTFGLHDRGRIVMQNLTDLNKALMAAETARIDLEAQDDVIRKGEYDSLPAVVNSALVQSLKTDVARLSAQYAAMANQFNDDYPPLAELKAKLQESRARLKEEIERVAESIESSYDAAGAREKDLEAEVAVEKSRAMALNEASLQDAVLAREVETNRELYRSVLERMKEIGVASEVPTSNVSIVDKADAPTEASSPRPLLDLFLSASISLVAGIVLAFFLEYLDDGIKNADELQKYVGLPSLGVVPDFASLNGNSYGPLAYVPRHTPAAELPPAGPQYGNEVIVSRSRFSVASEAYRAIRTAILLSRAGEPPKSILIASSTNGEGKTVTAVNTAFAFAQVGRRTLLIDADLRRSRCHEVLRVENHCGLTEVLVGQKKLDEVVHPTASPSLFFLSAGSLPPNPTELIGSARMREIIELAAAEYDCVLIDAAPVMPVSDTVILSTMVDGVLFVAGARTPKQVVRTACSRLGQVGAKIFGVVMNQVQAAGFQRYGYGYSYYYKPNDSGFEAGPAVINSAS
jgi:capsular exopolysaccharide synthesis family protein